VPSEQLLGVSVIDPLKDVSVLVKLPETVIEPPSGHVYVPEMLAASSGFGAVLACLPLRSAASTLALLLAFSGTPALLSTLVRALSVSLASEVPTS
jgi:hypothetical protein